MQLVLEYQIYWSILKCPISAPIRYRSDYRWNTDPYILPFSKNGQVQLQCARSYKIINGLLVNWRQTKKFSSFHSILKWILKSMSAIDSATMKNISRFTSENVHPNNQYKQKAFLQYFVFSYVNHVSCTEKAVPLQLISLALKPHHAYHKLPLTL